MVRFPFCLAGLPCPPKSVVVIVVAAFLSACHRSDKSNGTDESATEPPESSAESPSEDVKTRLAEWEKSLTALEGDPKAYGIKAAQFGEDLEIPPYQSVQFAMKHFEDRGARAGHYVKVLHRTMREDPQEALRVFSLIKKEGVDPIFHALAGAIGESDPKLGMTWLAEFPDDRQRGFAASRLGAGLVKFAASHRPEEVEPVITELLASDLFDEAEKKKFVKRMQAVMGREAK